MGDMDEFFTRTKANDGIKVPLSYPDGSLSPHWLMIRGIDSDAFREAETKAKRKAMELAQLDNEQEKAELIRTEELNCIASLVAGWSFDQPLTDENAVNLLKEAPQIADMINRLAAKRSEFFAKK